MVLEELDNDGPPNILLGLVFKTVKNAFIYGYRVRFLHSLAYQLATLKLKGPDGNSLKSFGLLLLDTIKRVIKSIQMGLNHGKILAGFAVIFRCSLIALNWINNKTKQRVRLENHYLAGFIGGILVYSGLLTKITAKAHKSNNKIVKSISIFGQFNESILTQITMYTLSRLILAIGRDCSYELSSVINKRRPTNKQIQPEIIRNVGWTVSCGLIWGGIMMYYRRDGDRKEKRKDYLQRALRVSLEFIYGGVGHAWKEAFDYGGK